ncbi:MAG TPA: dihydrofolate reductase [Casimicrobiaceae bacterium]|nr:dihydrofolate reductase [Casimicrobiaceae bacterium]
MTLPPLALIAAVARNGVIGRDGALPWRLPEDLRRFRTLTTGHSIVMGRRTWQSLPRALAGRQNVVVTRQAGFQADGAIVVHSLDAALAAATYPGPVFCIGGAELYLAAMPIADTAYITEIARDFEGDTTFPPLDPSQWRETARETHTSPGPDAVEYAFVIYERVRGGAR